MAFNFEVAGKIRTELQGIAGLSERKMFGGIAFMIDGNLACGVQGESLIVRVGPERHSEALAQPHARPFDFSGRPMSGWVYVDPDGYASAQDFKKWIQWGVEYASSLPRK